MTDKSYREQLIEEAIKYHEIMTEKRGYASMPVEALYLLDNDALERANKKTKQNYKKWGWI